MDNQHNTSPNQNDLNRPNSVDGFARPSQPSSNMGGSSSSPSLGGPTTTPNPALSSSHSPHNDSSMPSGTSEPGVTKATVSGGNKKSKLWTTILVILIIIIFAGGIYGVYAYQQKKINTANSQITTLTNENTMLKAALAKAQKASVVSVNTQNTSTGTTSNLTVFKIPELGVSLSEPASLGDITYVANSTKTAVNLSSKNLETADPACTATATTAPLGTITKGTGQFPTTPSTTTTLIKQYSTYYIAYVKPATNCSTSAQVNALAASLVDDLKTSFTTIQVITS